MSEPQAEPSRNEDRERAHPASRPPPADDTDDRFFPAAEATDETPTIISKNLPRPLPLDGALSGSLRGWRLAHFELLEPIGVGGMAAVLRARDTQLDRLVALKILPPDMAADAENVRRFHQEARSAAKLDHENIARVFFCGEDQRLHFIAFEFVEGENLRTLLEQRGPLPVAEALHYVLQVAAGLAHAARRGVVHRDIKPSNIIVTPNGRAKLVDMGLARTLEPQTDRGLTQSGVTLGTFDYISPEQALEPRDADVRSDIYSLGCTFYHMLTGHPPVPEGTAAKKLHHHQHVRPVDPRQFVPDLPAEVALVLDRMMAKQAKDRYQTPEHLVQHLLLAARKLGLAPEVPEGVLTVEADLPQPPGHRPLVLVALAAAAVVGLIFLLDPSPPASVPGPAPGTQARPDDGRQTGGPGPALKPVPPVQGDPGRVVKPTPVVSAAPAFTSAGQLADWLRQHADDPVKDIALAGDLDLTDLPGPAGTPGLLVKGRDVTVHAASGFRRRPTIRLRYNGEEQKGAWYALTLEGEKGITVEGVDFVIDGTKASVGLAALRLRGPKQRVSDCHFIQARPAYEDNAPRRLASLVAEPGPRGDAALTLLHCCFLGYRDLGETEGDAPYKGADAGGQDALVRRGPVKVHAEQCAFGPHEAAFRLEGEDDAPLEVLHCSMLLGRRSAVFHVPDNSAADLHVEASLFARARDDDGSLMGMGEREGAVLVRQESTRGKVIYRDATNRYYVDDYWREGEGTSLTWNEFQARCRSDGSKPPSQELATLPWRQPQPARTLESGNPLKAFEVLAGRADLRVPGLDRKPSNQLIGVEQIGSLDFAANLPPAPVRPTRLFLVQDGVNDSSKGIYPSLEQAVLAAQKEPGSEIIIRHDGLLELDPIVLKDTADLTIRADPRRRPILTLSAKAKDPDAALFRLRGGKLSLENLEFLLKPDGGFDTQSVVALAGFGQCTLKKCVATLDANGYGTRLALASLPKVGKVMKTDTAPPRSAEEGPLLVIESCFVRGDGDLVWGPAGRSFELKLGNTLAALAGSLLDLEAGSDVAGSKPSVLVQMQHVTTCLKGPLARLKDTRGAVPVRCRAEDCLFVPLTAERGCLIHLDVAEALNEELLKDRFRWTGSRNVYGDFASWVEQESVEGMTSPSTLDAWKRFSGDQQKYGIKPFPAADSLTLALPRQFPPPRDNSDCGAPTDKLPEPTPPSEPFEPD